MLAASAALLAALRLVLALPAGAVLCVGDCGLDGEVTVDEILVGVGIALGQGQIEACPAFDRDGDGGVTVDEILAAVGAALDGCTPNRAPRTADLPAYRTYPGQQVRVAIPGTDADGDRLRFESDTLPPGATLDSGSGVLSWVPGESDIGVYLVAYRVVDDGIPPLSAAGMFKLRVAVLEQCVELDCLPATGCTETPVDAGIDCCGEETPSRTPALLDECPEGAAIAVGRNADGFGPLRNCDELPVISVGQGGTRVTMHIAARCIYFAEGAQLRIQMYNENFVLVNRTSRITLRAVDNDYAAVFNLVSAIDDSQFEPFLLEGAEQILYVSVQDAHGLFVERTLRVRTTLRGRDDLPDDSTSPVVPRPAPQRLPLARRTRAEVASVAGCGSSRPVKTQ